MPRRNQLLAAVVVLVLSTVAKAVDLAHLPTNAWVPVHPTYVGAPLGGALFPMGWNNKGAFDPDSQRVLVYDRWYDPVRKDTIYANALVAFDPVSEVATVLKLSNWEPQPILCANGSVGCGITAPMPENATDPTPVDRHPLGCFAVAGDYHRAYLSNGLNQSANFGGVPGAPITDTWAFELSGGGWTLVSDTLTQMPNPPYTGPEVMIYDPNRKAIVLFVDSYYQGSQTWLFDPSVGSHGQWSSVPTDPTALPVHTGGSGIAYDTHRSRVTVFATAGINLSPNNAQTWAYSVEQNVWTRLADAPVGTVAPGFDYDSQHDVFLALTGTTTWIYEPAKDRWSQITAPIDRNGAGWYQSVTYDPVHDVFVHQGGTWDKPLWYVFRYQPAGVPPEIDAGVPANSPSPQNLPPLVGTLVVSGCGCSTGTPGGTAHLVPVLWLAWLVWRKAPRRGAGSLH